MEKLTKIETALLGLGMAMEDEIGHLYLSKLHSTAVSAQIESPLKLYGVIYDLWQLDLFTSINIEENGSVSDEEVKGSLKITQKDIKKEGKECRNLIKKL